MGEKVDVFKGATSFLENENTPVISPAVEDLVNRAKEYSPENPLYVVAIGAITNVASAILKDPSIAENIVVVWLGGNAEHYEDTKEFNMMQDVAAARVVMSSNAPFVQLPCLGVVSAFTISKPELEYWLIGKNKTADYLARNTINEAESYASKTAWTRCIWDVTAVAWLMNDGDRFMKSRIIRSHIPTYEHVYEFPSGGHDIRYVYHINRDRLMTSLLQKISELK